MSSRTSPSRRERRGRRTRGFTLIELLVTIAIIATLAAIVAPSLFGNIGQARRGTAKSQIQILSLALDSYRLDNEVFPTTQQGLESLRTVPPADPPPNLRGGDLPANSPEHWRFLIARHGRGVNVAMGDGSARWVPLEETYMLTWKSSWKPYRLSSLPVY